jgi:Bacterial Ig-like domain (group 3)
LNAGTASLSTAGLASGTRTIQAQFEGDVSFEPGSASSSHVVRSSSGTPTVTVSSSRNPSDVGQSVTLRASVGLGDDDSPHVNGSVEFYDGATLLGTSAIYDGRATFTTSSLTAGSHAITARYLGSASVPASRSRVMVQAVGDWGWRDRSTAMTLVSSASPAQLGDTIVLTATVASYSLYGWSAAPTGRILIMVNGEVVGDPAGVIVTAVSASSSRVTVSVPGLAYGKHIVSATYLGDPTYKGSTTQITQSVN